MALRLWNRELVCRQAVALFTEYLDGALPSRRRAALERHLAACPLCTRYLAQMRTTIATLGKVEPSDLPAPAMDELLEVFRRYREDPESSD